MAIQIIPSEDGSHTLFVPELNETYHSHKGALTESKHVFIKEGFDFVSEGKTELSILEVGFGTGLNAVLTLMRAEETRICTTYHTLEPFPLPSEIIQNLNYKGLLPAEYSASFDRLHETEWEKEVAFTEKFKFTKFQTTLQDFQSAIKYDLIYFDAFAPSKQPEVWDLQNLLKCYDLLRQGGILITYCAQGQFKRNLKAAGFEVETLPGPPGKKEMTKGGKSHKY